MNKILVIGANGFVGSAILRALAATPNFTPIAGSRRGGVRRDEIEQRVCDATNPQSLRAALTGVAAVVCAVLGREATMVAATHNVCEATRRLGLCNAVLISSMAVYGPAIGTVDETAALDPSLGAYGAAKVRCEAVARIFLDQGTPITILRPGIVYGPGGDQWIGRIGRLLRAGRLGDLGERGDGLCNLVYRDDMGAATVEALAKPWAAGQAFNVADREPLTWNDFFIDLGCMIGVPHVRRLTARRMRVETKLVAPPLQIAKIASSRLGLRPGVLPDPIPPSLLRLWQQRIRLDPRKSDELLDFQRTPRTRGLALSAEWFLARDKAAARLPGRTLEARA